MKRVIKFRVWDGEIMFVLTKDDYWYFQEMIDYDSHDVMQFTGLTDKNGVDIYEGDIVCLDGFDKWVIKYSANSFVGIPIDSNSILNKQILDNKNYLQFEVIGNIHENKELI